TPARSWAHGTEQCWRRCPPDGEHRDELCILKEADGKPLGHASPRLRSQDAADSVAARALIRGDGCSAPQICARTPTAPCAKTATPPTPPQSRQGLHSSRCARQLHEQRRDPDRRGSIARFRCRNQQPLPALGSPLTSLEPSRLPCSWPCIWRNSREHLLRHRT